MRTLAQRDYAIDLLEKYTEFMQHFAPNKKEKHMDMVREALDEAQEWKYKKFLYLIYNKKAKELEEHLSFMGIPRETLIDPKLL